jgi:Flp pilus assembly protein TadB
MTKNYKIKTDTKLVLDPRVNAEHTAFFSAKSWGILALIVAVVAILVALLVPSLSYWIRTALVATVLIIVLVLVFNSKARYALIMFLRWLDQKSAARRKL